MYTVIQFYFRLPIFLRLFLTVILSMIIFGMVIHFIEPSHFPTIFDGFWWAFVTGSTVGYGDYVPLSTLGRLLAILLILTGGGILTFYMATISAGTVNYERDLSSGKVAFTGENHLILVGWNERTRKLVEIIHEHNEKEKVVVIDSSMRELPFRKTPVHFIRGNVSDDDTLVKANIAKARAALITADPSKREEQADQAIIIGILAMKGCNPNLEVFAEILTERQIINAIRAGAGEVIRSNQFMSSVFFHEMYRNNTVKPFDLLLKILTEKQFHEQEPPEEVIDSSFLEGVRFYAEKKVVLLGLIKEGKIVINVRPEEIITANTRLITLLPK
ncbi:potassium channel family protein [Thalassobacillus pellis]|uniref:potassium channel family protein n=1 Tax=Thalassobacillus pellis TaxID=748008 RepID=UPI00195F4FE7|nr:potassium channel family protein [Thalassobacillus pellis]MBM7554854.1 voltage-gated potassium channel [Thalassobacillus pellis]